MVRTPLTEAVAAILEPLKGHHAESVFTYVCRRPKAGHRKGERLPLTYAGVKSEWQAMRKRAGVKGFRLHDVRHDFATKLLRKTGNLKLVSRALNHTDVKTTARYAHVTESDLSEALQGLSLSRPSPTKSPTRPRLRRRNSLRSIRKPARGRYVFETEGWRFEPVRARQSTN
jgi:integrase